MADEEEQAEVEVPELDVLMETEETFPPPDDFAADANISDPGVYEKAASDPEAWWASWAEKLEWIEPWDAVLDWSDPPHAKWFDGGKLNVSVNCLDRHVAAGNGDRIAFHWEAEDADDLGEGGRKEITYEWLLDQVQRFANVLKDLGVGKGDVIGIYMPMVPEAVAAMLGCARIGAIHNVVFGGFSPESVRERMEFSEAKVLVTADATLRRGDPLPMKEKVDEIAEQLDSLEHIVVLDRCGTNPPMTEGRDVFWQEAVSERRRDMRARADGRRGPALHPLHVGLDRQAQGHPPHHRRLPHPGERHAQDGLRLKGGVRRLLVRRGHRLDHRPHLHRLRAARERRDVRHVRGRAQLPEGGPLVGDHRALRRHDLLHGADGDPRVHEVGRRAPARRTT